MSSYSSADESVTDKWDIRHLVVCDSKSADLRTTYLAARALVLDQLAAGRESRIVLVTATAPDIDLTPYDVQVDILPILATPEEGNTWRLEPTILECIYSSAHAQTLFYIHDTRHPTLADIERAMLEQQVSCRPQPAGAGDR